MISSLWLMPHRPRKPSASASAASPPPTTTFSLSPPHPPTCSNMPTKKTKMPSKSKCQNMTLREENVGKSKVNVGSMLKLQHLQNIATWASGDGSIPSLAALYGRRLASNAAASGVSLDWSLLFCQRCETILQPGDNCTIRIEKNKAKAKHRKKNTFVSQNNVTYTCHFCSHRNVRRGTSKGHVKDLLGSRVKDRRVLAPAIKPDSTILEGDAMVETEVKIHVDGRGNISTTSRVIDEPNSANDVKETAPGNEVLVKESPITPNAAAALTKIGGQDGSAPSRTSVTAKGATSGTGGSRKRRRKGWSSLKDTIESSEHANKQNLSNLVIPFKL